MIVSGPSNEITSTEAAAAVVNGFNRPTDSQTAFICANLTDHYDDVAF